VVAGGRRAPKLGIFERLWSARAALHPDAFQAPGGYRRITVGRGARRFGARLSPERSGDFEDGAVGRLSDLDARIEGVLQVGQVCDDQDLLKLVLDDPDRLDQSIEALLIL
jgi:hypothetical protein